MTARTPRSTDGRNPSRATRLAQLKRSARELRQELTASAAEADAQNADTGYGMRRIWEEGFFRFNLPVEYGGISDADPGTGTEDFFTMLLDLAAGDSAAGMNYVVQSLVTLEVFARDNGLPESTKSELARRITDEGVRFVASNAETGSPRPVTGRRVEGGIVVNGTKTFNTNSGGLGIANVGLTMDGYEDGDRHIDAGGGRGGDGGGGGGNVRWHALVPLDQESVTCRHDWDVMGQRGTHSQTVDYDDVFVPDGYFYRSHGPAPQLWPYVFLMHAVIMLGPGYGAFDAARDYVKALKRPSLPEFRSASEDALIRKRIGGFAVDLEAARAYLLHCARRIEHRDEPGAEDTELAVESMAVKVACVRAGLDVTQGIFDLTGARATSNTYRFDRFWRNARTFSTHDSTDAKEVWIGDWHLGGKEPPIVAMLRV